MDKKQIQELIKTIGDENGSAVSLARKYGISISMVNRIKKHNKQRQYETTIVWSRIKGTISLERALKDYQ